ncbi:hypothetical protein [Hymenobacter wooponensis]|uniref:Uncharacterized protein n=1 Tax=Hymenobacter wooponensis TaxID=1525360 RepID=A0A4Z0MJD5_9BACT|nr:hypothetical protein [Hymenobacter wooponensis]TGD79654.1 hypothetical protein EU557_15665 [Hymenobacter wooponensis]
MIQRLLVLFLLLGLFSACESEKKEDPIPVIITDSITLNELQMQGDSVANLTWSALNNPDFVEYRVIRKEDPTEPTSEAGTSHIKAQFIGRHRDWNVPYTGYVQYQVLGVLSSGRIIESNVVTYRRPGVQSLNAYITDVQFDSQNRDLYFFGKQGDIRKFSLSSGKVTQSVQIGQNIGFCSFGTYQGRQELYVPCADGQILIYDAATLTKLDELTTNMGPLTDVLASNNQLFVSSTYYAGSALQTFSRATKARISFAGSLAWSNMRLKKVPGTTTEFIGVSLSISPVDQDYYRFSAAGFYQSFYDDRYHGDYPLDALLFEFSPTGEQYATGSEGALYRRDMTHLTNLPRSGNYTFTCYGFDPAAQMLYAGTSAKTIEAISLNGYRRVKSQKTRLYPVKLFQDGNNGFISVSSTYRPDNYYYGGTASLAKIAVERFN